MCDPIDGTRLCHPWDSPGKNTGVGRHLLLQCMKVKSESEVAQLCPTLSDPMDCSPPGSSVHGTFQAKAVERGAIALPPQPHLNGNFLSKMCSSDLNVSDTSTLGSRHFLDLLPECQNNHTVIPSPAPSGKNILATNFRVLTWSRVTLQISHMSRG